MHNYLVKLNISYIINTILLKTINDLHFYLFLCLNFLLLYGTY